MLVLTRRDVYELVPMADAIELVKRAFRDLCRGEAHAPLRTPLEVPQGPGTTLFMPAFVPSVEGLGLKVVSVFPENPRRFDKPTIHAVVLTVSTTTGEPTALLDGTYLTALRTGAASGAATDLLARPDARKLLVIGAGAQGPTQAWAVLCVRPIDTVYVYDRDRRAGETFERRLRELVPELAATVVVVDELGTVLPQVDVICTATTAREPLFDDALLPPGVHINAIGAFTPEMQEIPPETIARAYVVVDSVPAALAEAGDLIKPLRAGVITEEHIRTEIGEIVDGRKPGRTSSDQVTVFKSVGNAVQDLAVASEAVRRAQARARGQTISLA
ncbi:MAG: ornithine cyclodeaminase [Thermomicrobium sp.]|nr:ornithine cyclodeaminase [Thermomicrobium sp.]